MKEVVALSEIEKNENCCCGEASRKVLVEYLYLDLQTCDRCCGTDYVLEEVLKTLAPALQLAGYEVEFRRIEMSTRELAEQYSFLSSPTIRVNGYDICSTVEENVCGCCSNISRTAVDCRVFRYKGQSYEIPPKEMLAEAILRSTFSVNIDDNRGCGKYEMPENLKIFYDGKNVKDKCSGGSNS